MKLTLSSETVTINGQTIPKVYGGFCAGQPAILAKQVAKIHEYEVKKINELVNKNIDWFDEGIDYINLKSMASRDSQGVVSKDPLEFLIKSGFYQNTKAIGGAKYIYLFSQQGYAMLCKLLKSNIAKQIYKQMVREYFRMVEIQYQIEEKKLTQLVNQSVDNAQQLATQAEILKASVAQMYRNKENIIQQQKNIDYNSENIIELKERISALEQQRYSVREQKMVSMEKQNLEPTTPECITSEQIEILKKKVKEKGRPIAIWKKFNKAFDITRYKFLPKSQFQEAIEWIKKWE